MLRRALAVALAPLVRAKWRGARLVSAAIHQLPIERRSRLIARTPGVLLPAVVRGGRTHDRAYWDGRFARGDPWGFDWRPEEQRKYEATLELCGDGPFDSALEIGSATGAFTELLATRCRSLLAVEVSSVASAIAAHRLRGIRNVRCEARALPDEFPEGDFDLVVASDVLYYWPAVDVITLLARVEESLVPCGKFVALHYAPSIGAILDGEEVHRLMRTHSRLANTRSETREFTEGRPYYVDTFVREHPNGGGPSERDG